MKKKLYFVHTNAYEMIISDDGEKRRVLVDNPAVDLHGVIAGLEIWLEKEVAAERFLNEEVEDDSSWEEYEETVDELTDGDETDILAEIEKDI